MKIEEIALELDKLSQKEEYKNLKNVEFMHLVYLELLKVREGNNCGSILKSN